MTRKKDNNQNNNCDDKKDYNQDENHDDIKNDNQNNNEKNNSFKHYNKTNMIKIIHEDNEEELRPKRHLEKHSKNNNGKMG